MISDEPIDPWADPHLATPPRQLSPSPSPQPPSPSPSPPPQPVSPESSGTPPKLTPVKVSSAYADLAPGILSPIEPHIPISSYDAGFTPLVSVVDFHHARGPEVEHWFGAEGDPTEDYGWGLLPFMALSDGAHASSEDFSYFTLLRPSNDTGPATSLFGIACTRQLDATALINRPPEVTRSTVQKAVVVITDSPQHFGMLRERLSIVTQAWFAQRDFTDVEILIGLQESLADQKRRGMMDANLDGGDQYLGLSLREFVHEFKWQTLVLLKCCLLQPKMLFFGTRCDRLCMVQFCLISLIPRLIRNLQDCADPALNNYEKTLTRAVSFKSSDRGSKLAFTGLPLQIFGTGALFGPYTPLQQLDLLADKGTKSYIVGSTNSLLLQQRDRYSDILINLDENSINISSPSLRSALNLTSADRKWIDFIVQSVNDTWDDANPANPTTLQYQGSETFIRMQFEEYIIGMLSSVRYHHFLTRHPAQRLPHIDGDPSSDYGNEFVDAWSRTENHRMWLSYTDDALFDLMPPKHPCSGNTTIDEVQRRISEQVKELHLDEKLSQGKEAIGRNWAAGKDRASQVVNRLWSDMDSLRDTQKKREDEEKEKEKEKEDSKDGTKSNRQSMSLEGMSVGQRASSYMNSWTSWAGEKRKTSSGWSFGRSKASTTANTPASGSPKIPGTPTGTASPRASLALGSGSYRSLHAPHLSGGSEFELGVDVRSSDEEDEDEEKGKVKK